MRKNKLFLVSIFLIFNVFSTFAEDCFTTYSNSISNAYLNYADNMTGCAGEGVWTPACEYEAGSVLNNNINAAWTAICRCNGYGC